MLPAVAQQLRTFNCLWLQIWPLELSSVSLTQSSVIGQHICRTTLSNATLHGPFFLHNHFTSQKAQRKEKGEKLSYNMSTKSYYTQKVILVYLSSLLSLLVQGYRNGPIWVFFFVFFPPFSLQNPVSLAPLCCVQRPVHLLSTTGKVFVFICFHKLQGAEAFRGGHGATHTPRVGTDDLHLPLRVRLQKGWKGDD